MAFVVKEVDNVEKSVQEVEQILIEKHEQEVQATSGEPPKKEEGVEQVKIPSSKPKEPKVEKEPIAKQETTKVDPIDEDSIVLSKIKTKFNKDYASIDELYNEVETLRNSKVEIPDDIQAMMKFKKETNRPIEDFIKLNRDYTKEQPLNVIAEFNALQNPELNEDEIKFMMDNKYSFDVDLDDEKEIKQKQIALKKDLSDALKYFNKQKEEYKTPLASSAGNLSDADKTAYEEFRKYAESSKQNETKGKQLSDFFMQKTKELFNDDFKGFGIKVNDKEFLYKPDESAKLLQQQSDVSNFISKHLNEDGYIKDAGQYHKALAFAMNPDAVAKYFYEQGVADSVTEAAKASKNIDMNKVVPARESTNKSGFNVSVVGGDQFENGLKVRVSK